MHLIEKYHQSDIILVHQWSLSEAHFCIKIKCFFLFLMCWVLSNDIRLFLTCLAFVSVFNALIMIKINVIVHVEFCCLCLLSVMQVTVLITTTWVTFKDHVISVIVARVLIKIVFTDFDVLMIMRWKTKELVTVDELSIVVMMSVLMKI